MQKIYVLLRNDKQTGPYSLDEIVKFDLKPYDLIWIEGKSAGWYYPQEIGALHSYLSFLPQKPVVTPPPEVKKVFVAMPVTPVKKEEPQPAPPPVEATISAVSERYISPSASSSGLEEEVYAHFAKQEAALQTPAASVTTTKRRSPKTAAVTALTILVVGAVFAASWIMNRHTNEEEAVPTQAVDTTTSNEIKQTAVADPNTTRTPAFRPTKGKPQKTTAQVKLQTAIKQTAVQKSPKEVAVTTTVNDPATSSTETTVIEDEQVTAKEDTKPAPAETNTAPQEKKKKLRDKIFDIFRKKEEEPKTEESKPAETTNGERTATRRESGASLAQMVSIRFTVPNDWMMGIKGAKATLVNRSNETVSKAVVEIMYYDDDNQLLQKKTITFSKVEGKESQTISIPDHSSATRVDYNIVSVTGKPAA